jgi:hypothetical protein
MKKFIRKLQHLGDSAARFQEALQLVPPKVAEIRGAVSAASGQLRQLQAELQGSVAGFKAEGPDRLVEALHEIYGGAAVIMEAGYELGEFQLELTPVPRLLLELDRVRDVSERVLQSLLKANAERSVLRALLGSIVQAESMVDRVDLAGQVYYRLMVHVGPVPSVRLVWKAEAELAGGMVGDARAPVVAEKVMAAAAGVSLGRGSFFESRSAPVAAVAPQVIGPAVAAGLTARGAGTGSAIGEGGRTVERRKDWGKSALERFKTMPGTSKYSGAEVD